MQSSKILLTFLMKLSLWKDKLIHFQDITATDKNTIYKKKQDYGTYIFLQAWN